MKKATIYFEGNFICEVEFNKSSQLVKDDGVVLWTKFFIDDKEVGYFNGNYSYVIVCQQQ